MSKVKVILLLLVSLISLNITGYSQTITIKGKVTDSLGNPLSGVNVEAKLGKVGTSTNLQGLYIGIKGFLFNNILLS